MSDEDVHGHEMDAPHDSFDDETAEALLGGGGRDVDPELAELLGDVRAAYTSTPPEVGAELAALIGTSAPAAGIAHRRGRMRSHLAARFAAATVAVVAAMSGLAIAGALPAPVQDALSLSDSADETTTTTMADETTTTTVDNTTTTTVDGGATTTTIADDDDGDGNDNDNHGAEVSAVARDKSLHGCEHGRAVSAIASGKTNDKECKDHEADDDEESTPTSVAGDDDSDDGGQANGGNNGRGKGHDKNDDSDSDD
jgi:hypothetical protein